MSEVTAKQVQDLRKMSGAGMMDCKNALAESEGSIEDAFKWLREKGIAKAEKKSTRDANEGLVGIKSSDDGASIVEINSETDFVSRNAEFHSLVNNVLDIVTIDNNEAMSKTTDLINDAIAKIGENIVFKRSDYVPGKTFTYIHNKLTDGLGKIGVILKLTNTDIPDEVGKNICMHIAACAPKSLSEDDLDQNLIDNEKSILKKQLKDSGKPDDIILKMIDGKIKKYFEENVLLNQKFVIDPSLSIASYLKQSSKEAGKDINIENFIRYELGE